MYIPPKKNITNVQALNYTIKTFTILSCTILITLMTLKQWQLIVISKTFFKKGNVTSSHFLCNKKKFYFFIE